jgi:predicted ArsR family transcriptional regulator
MERICGVRKHGDAALAAVARLTDPVRRDLFAFVSASSEPVGRDEAANAVGITRTLAGYHLDQLADAGLLDTTFVRRSGRSGPGAGRPAKLYEAAAVEVTVQLPPRDDALVAHLLATAIESDASGAARRALRRAARAEGRALGAQLAGKPRRRVLEALQRRGYAPVDGPDGMRLRNCPFHHLVGDHPDLVCSLNKDLLGAAAESAGGRFAAHLDPQPGQCCVVLRAR